MELHTLSVNGGYIQADVTALSSILTGWTVSKPNGGGPFLFDPKSPQPGPKQWLGHAISANTPGAPNWVPQSSPAPSAKVGSGGAASAPIEGRSAPSPRGRPSSLNQLIHQQIAQLATAATTPADTLTALTLGSPDFQLR